MFGGMFVNGLNGLMGQNERLSAISDNIANATTNGFKKSDVRFENLMRESGKPAFQTTSVAGYTKRYNQVQGELKSVTQTSNASILGKGFFVVNTKADSTGQTFFTRLGDFEANSDGELINGAGLFLQGYKATNSSVTSGTTVGSLTTVKATLNTIAVPKAATTTAEGSGNIPNPATKTVGTQFNNALTVLDSAGAERTIDLTWTSTATGYTVSATASNGTATVNGGTTATVAFPLTSLNLGVTWNTGAVASTVAVTMSSVTANGNTVPGFTMTLARTDGNLDLTVEDIVIKSDGSGDVMAELSDGSRTRIARIGVATFVEPDQLDAVSGTSWVQSAKSGEPVISNPLSVSLGSGSIVGSTLEQSNVDLADELATLIVVQKSYSFNSTILTTADQMYKSVIDLKS